MTNERDTRGPGDRRTGRSRPVLVVAFVALVVAVPLALGARSIAFRDFGIAEVGQALSVLFLVALFLERSLEVFLNTWRGPGAAEHQFELDEAQAGLARAAAAAATPEGEAALREAQGAVRQATLAAGRHKLGTQRLALWAAFVSGIAVSAVGVRSIEGFLDATLFDALPTWQHLAFQAADVVLTGGLIAGGSEAIHKLTQVYTTFLDATAKKTKAAA